MDGPVACGTSNSAIPERSGAVNPLGLSVFRGWPAVLEQRRARGGVNTQRPQREARGRTVLRPSRGRRTHSVRRRRRHVWLWWSASDSVDRVGGRRSCEPFLRGGACMKPCGRPRLVRGREATQLVDRTRGWVMALPGLHEVFVGVVTLLMPRPCWSSSGPGRRAARSRRPRASAWRRRPWRCCGRSSSGGPLCRRGRP